MRLYPRSFREEYGDDMVLLFAEQRRDDGAVRVWVRGLIDLAVTVPTQHLEATVHRSPGSTVPYVYAGGAAVAALAASAFGAPLPLFLAGVVVAMVLLVLAVSAWRRTRTIGNRRDSASWWQVLLAGCLLLASTIVTLRVVGEVSEAWWLPAMFTLLIGVATVAMGVVLGLARLVTDPRQ